ncbi:MAG: hypothetical protein M3321_10570 [Actinomycetota bacterium]|nr:hypothetical protein [Actinomycetota bacterium]
MLAVTFGDVAFAALSFFLVATGVGLLYVSLRLGGTLARLSSFIRGAENEVLPVINKVGGTVDRMNAQFDKVDLMTDSAVDAVDSVDTAVRAVSHAIAAPVQKLSGLAAGLTYGVSELRASRSWRAAVEAGKDAAARRERELAEELRVAGGERAS